MLDEPSSNLDPAARRELADIVKALDMTTLMVTHDLPYALELCPRAVVMNDGLIVADGPTREILSDAELMRANRLELPFGFDPLAPADRSLQTSQPRHRRLRGTKCRIWPMAAETSTAEGRQHHPMPRPDRSPIPAVDIALPVHNEEQIIEASVERLHRHLSEHFPYSWQITIAENGSTDATRLLGQRLASELREVRFVSVRDTGRGGALRRAWSESSSEVLAYMDVDLSTDLAALNALVAPLVSDDADVAIGSRLSPESLVRRSPTARC